MTAALMAANPKGIRIRRRRSGEQLLSDVYVADAKDAMRRV